MPVYKVKVYYQTGESLTFLSREIDSEDNPFGTLGQLDYLYFNYQDHKALFNELVADNDWYSEVIWYTKSLIINFLVYPTYKQAPEFLGLSRAQGQALALEEGLSFRVVYDDGVIDSSDSSYNASRVNVYLNQDNIFKAEFY